MIELFRAQSRSAAGAIVYVTAGTLMIIWAGLWYYYFLAPAPNPPIWQKFACVGTILSGFAIGVIGLLFGLIGRGAKGADTTVGAAATGAAIPAIPVVRSGANVVSGAPPSVFPVASVSTPTVSSTSSSVPRMI